MCEWTRPITQQSLTPVSGVWGSYKVNEAHHPVVVSVHFPCNSVDITPKIGKTKDKYLVKGIDK